MIRYSEETKTKERLISSERVIRKTNVKAPGRASNNESVATWKFHSNGEERLTVFNPPHRVRRRLRHFFFFFRAINRSRIRETTRIQSEP